MNYFDLQQVYSSEKACLKVLLLSLILVNGLVVLQELVELSLVELQPLLRETWKSP